MLPHHVTVGPPDAPALVLIHGFPFSLEQWRPQLDGLEDAWRVVAYDLRGHGQSATGPGPLFIEDLVDDLVELLDHLGLESACLGGLSMGGYIALRAVDREPSRIHGLVLADTKAGADDNAGRVKRAQAAKTVRAKGMSAFADGLLPALFPKERLDPPTSAVREVRAMIEATSPEGAALALGAMASRLDLRERLADIRVPTLVVVGEDDTLTPPAEAEALVAGIPDATLVRLDGAGHVSNLEAPDAFTDALRAFLERMHPRT